MTDLALSSASLRRHWINHHPEIASLAGCTATSRGFFIAAGNALSNCLLPMPIDTQMTHVLLLELLMALRATTLLATSLGLLLALNSLEGM